MSFTKEEIKTIVTNFNKISDREEKKSPKSKHKLILLILLVILIIAAVYYFYGRKSKGVDTGEK